MPTYDNKGGKHKFCGVCSACKFIMTTNKTNKECCEKCEDGGMTDEGFEKFCKNDDCPNCHQQPEKRYCKTCDATYEGMGGSECPECEELFAQQPEKEELNMDASQWKNYGLKYGYWNFFETEIRKDWEDEKNISHPEPSREKELEDWKDSYKGKLWSTAVQKCFEAPFVEVAIQHLLKIIDEKHQAELLSERTALVKEIRKLPEALRSDVENESVVCRDDIINLITKKK